MTALNNAFSVLSGTGFILWSFRFGGVVQCGDVHIHGLTALACLVHSVDSILWDGNATIWAPRWCDTGAFRSLLAELTDPYLSQTLPSDPHPNWCYSRVGCLWTLHHPPSLLHRFSYTVTTSQADVRFRSTSSFTTPLLSLFNRNVAS